MQAKYWNQTTKFIDVNQNKLFTHKKKKKRKKKVCSFSISLVNIIIITIVIIIIIKIIVPVLDTIVHIIRTVRTYNIVCKVMDKELILYIATLRCIKRNINI